MNEKKIGFQLLICLLTVFSFVIEGEARRVRVAIPSQAVTQIAFYAGKDKGYYQQEGLEVEIILMSAPVANLAVLAGNVEFSTVPSAALTAALRGAPLRILSATFYRPLFWLYVKPDIRDVKALKGKKVGSSGLGSASDTLLRDLLKRQGLEGGRDVVILNTGSNQTRYAALLSGHIEATPLSLPWNFWAEEAGFRELVSFVKQDIVQLTGCIIAGEGLLQSDPLLVEKFVRGTLKGFHYARDNRSETIPILARNTKIKEDLAARIYESVWPGMTPDGTISKELQREVLEPVIKVQGIKESPAVEKFFDFSLAGKINAELKAKR